MKKVGVLVTLNFLVLSSVILVFSLNTTVNLTPLDPNDEIIEDVEKTPQSSASSIYYYKVQQSPYTWYDLKNDPSATNISWSFTSGRDNGYYTHGTSFQIKVYDLTSWSIYISTNGYVSISDSAPWVWWNFGLPINGINFQGMIAPFQDDINLNNGGEVFVRDFAGDKIVIEYNNVYHNNFNQIGSFEIVFTNDSGIYFNYQDINYIADGYTCGLNQGDGVHATEYTQLTSSTVGLTLNWTYTKPELIFWDDFESGGNPMWSQNLNIEDGDYWHISNESMSFGMNYSSPIRSLRCANKTTKIYERNNMGWSEAYTDVLTIENINLQDFEWAELTFNYKNNTNSDDKFLLNVYMPGGAPGYELYFDTQYVQPQILRIEDNLNSFNMWNFTYNLSPFCGYDRIDIQFVFDASNISNNFYPGVFIDDVNITGLRKIGNEGNQLSINVNDVFYYHFESFDLGTFQSVFGKIPDIGFDPEYEYHPSYGDEEEEDPNQIKIQVKSIMEYPDYWKVTIRFWMPFENFDNIGAGEEMAYKVFKNPLNFKGGSDFFIPNNNIWDYLWKADNVESGGPYAVDYLNFGSEAGIRLYYGDYNIILVYNPRGILKSFNIDRTGFGSILSFSLRDDYCEDCDNYNEPGMMIPGYDLFITLSVCGVVSIVIAVRRRKLNTI